MRKITIFLLICSMFLSFAGCGADGFKFENIDNIDDLKCCVYIKSINVDEAENGIDDGFGDSTSIIEDPTIKEAYRLISYGGSSSAAFDTESESKLISLTFYSGDSLAGETDGENVKFYGVFNITESGKFTASSAPYDDTCYYYVGSKNLYNSIIEIISRCKY